MIDKINLKKKVVITAAVTGSITSKSQNPYLPVTPEEVAEECYRAWKAGAAIAHLHARDPRPEKTDVEVLGETIRLVRERCGDMITQVGTGIRSRFNELRTPDQRLLLLGITPKPDMDTINAGTFDFEVLAQTSPENTGYTWLFNNSPELIEAFAKGMKERKIIIEFEAYDHGHVWNIVRLLERGVIDQNDLHVNLVMGIGGGMPATPKMLISAVEMLPKGTHWTAMAPGKEEFPICALAAMMGGNVRVGLEDNVYLSRGVLAEGNAPIVAKMARIIQDLGMEVATSTEAREMLNIPYRP
ncbi:MAG: 3-keto-5-aminohexanoate cleavage protein [Actinobacteria bacterium]|nr:3-keto-5-aminohexanoate cleavage protein [Actinomycetota bacterium]